MIDRQVETWCVQTMTVQELKPRGGSEGPNNGSGDILSPPEVLENDKDSFRDAYPPQDSENLLGRVLAGKNNTN
ncbi:Protein of unknown function [Cotesia congregata]|uniref:Uncharacterized protein n=1 Tax=Cotesia congregata TaxID=51543 RepID=A0A8J2H3B1_COTCN|nr:Protein of unknown function [Cotesia congregata]